MAGGVQNKSSMKVAGSSKADGTFENNAVRKPTSPFIPVTKLISALSKSLPFATICLMRSFHRDLLEKRITRQQLVDHCRGLVGDGLLIATIRSYNNKKVAAPLRSRI